MSDAPTAVERPAFGPQGEPCANCGARLARDQRYCLECGTRRAGMDAMLAAPSAVREITTERRVAEPVAAESPWKLDAGLLAGVGCLLLALLVGVLIGRSGGGSDGASKTAASPQVITVGSGATAGSGTTAAAAFKSDWPAGKRGFTVQLQTLPKASSDAAKVAAAKQAAAAKGAADVGALDSDAFGTLAPGAYVVYSGLFADRKAAGAALAKLKGSFPSAKVVEVASGAASRAAKKPSQKQQAAATGKSAKPSAAEQAAGAKAIQDVQNATGKDYSKKSAKLPDKLATPGQPPPKDLSKPAGGGSDVQTFK